MKTFKELKQGKCKVVTDHGIFEGFYSEKYPCVFFTIPSHYKIIGYIQVEI